MTKVYVQVYDRLRSMIEDGTFPVGSPLPAETKLAKMLDTSRMTLRQALDLLHQDGLVRKVRGSGNYVQLRNSDTNPSLHQLGNPVDKCLKKPYDLVESECFVEQTNEYAREVLGADAWECVSSYQYYYRDDKMVAYTFSLMSLDMAEELQLDLQNKKKRDAFFQQEIYGLAKRAHIEIIMDLNVASLWQVPLKEEEQVSFMEEKIYGEDYKMLVINKHYFLTEECRVTIEAE